MGFDGPAGIAQALDGEHALILLDVMMPGTDGFEVLRRIREQSRTPVLMLTARGDTRDRVRGLEMGADDYLPKPFDPAELVARIRAILRRARAANCRRAYRRAMSNSTAAIGPYGARERRWNSPPWSSIFSPPCCARREAR